MKDVEGSF